MHEIGHQAVGELFHGLTLFGGQIGAFAECRTDFDLGQRADIRVHAFDQWSHAALGDPAVERLDFLVDDLLAAFNCRGALAANRLDEVAQRIDIHQRHVGESRGLRINIPRDGEVDEQLRLLVALEQ